MTWKFWRITAASAALVVACAAGAASPDAEQAFRSGMRAYAVERNPVAARTHFLQASRLDPAFPAPRFNLAQLAESEERWSDAADWYRQYLALQKEGLYADVARRKIALLASFAEMDATAAGRQRRNYLQLLHKAQARLAAGQPGAALALVEMAAGVLPDQFEAELLRGAALMEAERYGDALAAFQAARTRLGGSAASDKDAIGREIDELANRARELADNQERLRKAAAAFQGKAYAEAAAIYSQVWALTDRPEVGLQAARAWGLGGAPERALKIYGGLAASPQKDVAERAAREGAALAAAGQSAGTAGAARGPGSEHARAQELLRAGKLYEAEAVLTTVLDGLLPAPEYASMFELRGVARAAQKEYAGAVRDLSVALLLNGKRASAYQRRADALAALNRFDEAARDLDKALEFLPADAHAASVRNLRTEYRSKAGNP